MVGFVCFRWVQWGERESGSNDTCCLACLFCSFCRVSLFVPLFFPPRRPYTGTFFLVFVLVRSCSSYMFLSSTYVVLLAAFLTLHHILQNCRLSFVFCLFRPYAGILFLVFVLFRPCSSYLFPFSTYVVLLAAFLVFLDHILQNSCRLFGLFSSFFYFSGLACFVVFSYQVR